jgi:hypothetical protein
MATSHCTAISHRRRRIQRYRSLTWLTDVSLLPDPINAPRWPPESYLATTGDTNTTTATTAHPRQEDDKYEFQTPISPPVLELSKRMHPSVPKVPRSHKRGFAFSPVLGLPFRCTGPDGNPPEPTQAKILSPKYPSARTTPQRYLAEGATAPKCRRALSLGASADALPRQARSRSEVRRIACLAKQQQPAPTQPTHTTPTLFQWEFTAAAPATTQRGGLAFALALSAHGEEAVNNTLIDISPPRLSIFRRSGFSLALSLQSCFCSLLPHPIIFIISCTCGCGMADTVTGPNPPLVSELPGR